MHKLNKYIASFKNDVIIVESERSTYYNFNGHILRVSDHIGLTSSGAVSIIITNDSHYVVHRHCDGNIMVMNYEEIKEFVKSFRLMSKVFISSSPADRKDFIVLNNEYNEVKAENDRLKKQISVYEQAKENELVLGLPLSRFTNAQVSQIKSYVKQRKK